MLVLQITHTKPKAGQVCTKLSKKFTMFICQIHPHQTNIVNKMRQIELK